MLAGSRRGHPALAATLVAVAALVLSAGSAWSGTFYSQGSLAPSALSSWNSIRAGGGSAPASFTSGDVFVVQNGNVMATSAAWTVSGSGAKIQIESGGTLTANHLVAVPTFQVDNGGAYIHAAASGSSNGAATDLPGSTSRSFGATSTVEIQKWANGGGAPVALPSVSWGNLTVNVASLGGNWNQAGAVQTVNGNLTVQATGGGSRQLQLSGSGTTTFTIAGNYSQSGGVVAMATSNNAVPTLNAVNFSLTGGTFSVAEANNITPTVNVTGDFTHTAGTLIDNGNSGGSIVFKKSGTQVYASGGTVTGAIAVTVNSGSTLNLGTSVITGSGAFTLSSGAGIMIGSAAGITSSGATGNVQSAGTRSFSTGASYTYSGSVAQVTGSGLPATVNNLTINDAAGVTLTAGVTVNGALSLTSGTLSIGTSTVVLNAGATSSGGLLSSAATGLVNYAQGSAGQAVLAGTYGNLTLSNFNKTLSSTGTIAIAGTFTPGTATGHTVAGSTILFSGSGPQTIPAFAYGSLSSSGSAGRTLAASGTIKIAGTFTPGSNAYTLTGSTIEYNGASAQSLPATFATYNHLTINNAAGVSLGANVTVNGALNLAAGTVTTGGNTLIAASGGSVTRTSGYVAGSFRKPVATGATAVTFEIGSSAYSPMTVAFGNVTVAGSLTASATPGDHPSIGGSGIDATKSVNRYWSLNNSGVAFNQYAVTLDFVPADLDPGANTSNFVVRVFSSPNWTAPAIGTRTATSVQATGLTTFSDFAAGEPQTYTLTASAGSNGTISPAGSVVVAQGAGQVFTLTPSTHYHVADVVVDGASVGAVGSYAFTNVTASHTIAASFAIDTYTLTASAGAHGAISPSGPQTVAYGDGAAYVITPDAHYHVADVLVDGVSVGAVTSYSFDHVAGGHAIVATFAIDTYTITASAGAHGAISPSGAVVVDHGSDQAFTIVPNANHHVADVMVDGVSVGAVTSYSFAGVTAPHTIQASFAIDTRTLTASAGAHGAISPDGPMVVDYGSDHAYTLTPDVNHHVADVLVDSVSVGAVPGHTFTNVTADHSIEASFSIDTHTVTASAGAHGAIDPSGSTTLEHGADVAYTITPDAHYHIADVLADGVSVGPVASYAFTGVAGDHTLAATFAIDTRTITASAGAHGSVGPSGAVTVGYGGDATFTVTPDAHHHVADVLVDGASVGAVASYAFTNVSADHTVEATFAIDTYTLTASAGAHGAIDPVGALSVDFGTDHTYTVTPDAHYHVADVLVDGVSVGAVTSYTLSGVAGDHTLEATFAIDTHTITASAGAHGAIDPSGAVGVEYGAGAGFTITPDAHYHIADVMVDGVSVGPIASHTFSDVTADHTIEASFAIDTYTLTASPGAHGAVDPAGSASVDFGTDHPYTITPDTHYHVADVLVDGASVGAVTSYTFVDVTADHAIDATFAIDTYTITASAGAHGAVSPSGATSVDFGTDHAYTVTPDAHYHVADVLVDGVSVGAVASYAFTNVSGDHTVEATFAIDTYTLTASAGAHGAIDPAGAMSVDFGTDHTYTVTPDTHYHVADVLVDGVSVGAVTSYAFTNVTADHTIAATFAVDTYTLTASTGAHGAIDPAGAMPVDFGTDHTYNVTPDAHYHVADVLVDGVSVGAVTNYAFTNVGGDHTIAATFAIDTRSITASAGAHGSVGPSGAVTVGYGGDAAFTITPDAHDHVADVLVDGVSVGAVTSYAFTDVTADHTLEASFAIDTYTLTASAGAHGSIDPAGAMSVDFGTDHAYTVTPDAHYHVADVLVDGVSVGAVTNYAFTNVAGDHTIAATFAIDTQTITASAGAHGSVGPSGAVTVGYGGDAAFTITPDAHHHVADVLVDGVSVGAVTSYAFVDVTADHTIDAAFAIDTYTLTASAGAHGAIDPVGAMSVDFGTDHAYTVTPDAHYHVADVLVDGVSVGAVASYTFSGVAGDHTLAATFAIDTYTITASAGAHGAISPVGAVGVAHGTDVAYTVTPDAHCHVADVLVDGVSVGAVASYGFTNVAGDHTIAATFAIDTQTITASAGAHGAVGPSGAVTVGYGGHAGFTITPDAHYHVADVLVDGVSVGAVASYAFTHVTADHTLDASFAIDTYTLTASAGAHGAIDPVGVMSVDFGTDHPYTITPDTDYHVADVLVDGVSVGAVTSYAFTNVTGDHTLEASFAADAHTLTATAGPEGSISPAGTTSVAHGGAQSFTITPGAHHHVADVLVDGVSVGVVTGYTFTNVTGDHAIAASFAIDTHSINASAGAHGSISPTGSSTVNGGSDVTYTISADPSYQVLDVIVDGASQGAVGSYTFAGVAANHSISASFEVVFPATVVRDAFTGANGPLVAPWAGGAGLTIANHSLVQTISPSYAIWNGGVFGPDQEAYYRIDALTVTAPEHDLLLKVQGTSWTAGAVQVVYSAPQGLVVVNTYTPGSGWTRRGGPWHVTFQAGDQLGARVLGDGRVRVYRNGARIGQTTLGSWPFAGAGGRIGLILAGASSTHLHDFGGGSTPQGVNTPPVAGIVSPAPGAFFVAGAKLFVAGTGTDAQDAPASLAYRWEVLDAVNHVIGETRTARNDSLPIPVAGAPRKIRLTVTDTGDLTATAEVAITPEVDLTPTALTPVSGDPSGGTPTPGTFTILNLGHMPSPQFHWIVLANGAAVAQGDTAVAAQSGVAITCTLPAVYLAGYDVRVTVDTTGAVVETDETNNVSTQVWGESPFPTAAVLDTLTGPNGPMGNPWSGGAGLGVNNHALTQTLSSSYAIWNGGVFGPNQEAYYRFNAVSATAPEHDLLLKVQGTSWTAGAVQVVYSAPQGVVVVNTYTPGSGWVRRGGPWRVTFQAGDQFGARALGDGRVGVYRNGTRIGQTTLGSWPFASAGGRIGLILQGATSSHLHHFGGGNAHVAGAALVASAPDAAPSSSLAPPTPSRDALTPTIQLSVSSPQPNPTLGQAAVQLALPRAARVRMRVYDPSGRVVSEGVDQTYGAGHWTLRWNGAQAGARPLPTGLYFMAVDIDGTRFIRRVNLVR